MALKNASAAIRFCLAQVGKPYVYGAQGPNSYDCSGLMMKGYAAAGYSIPRTTEAMIADPSLQVVSKNQLAPGDLVFPESGHVQMYLGGGKVVEAPHTGLNVRIAPLGTVQYARRVTTPAPGNWTTGNASPVDNTTPASGPTQADITSLISQGIGAGIPKFFVNILAPVGSWFLWAGETAAGLAMIAFGIFIVIKQTPLGRIGSAL